jgi:hypothetical protein
LTFAAAKDTMAMGKGLWAAMEAEDVAWVEKKIAELK